MAIYFPLEQKRDVKVRAAVSERLAARSKANHEAWELLPGMKLLSGRERLAWYETKDETYWGQLAATHPMEAHATLLDFAQLARQYR